MHPDSQPNNDPAINRWIQDSETYHAMLRDPGATKEAILSAHPAQLTNDEIFRAIRMIDYQIDDRPLHERIERAVQAILFMRPAFEAVQELNSNSYADLYTAGPESITEPEPETISDEALLQQYESHIRKVAAIRRRDFRLSKEDGEDIAQQMRIDVCGIPQDKRSSPEYVRSVINNAARRMVRSITRKQEGQTELDEHTAAAAPPSDQAQVQAKVADLLDALTPVQRQVIEARFGFVTGKQLSRVRDIAIALGMRYNDAKRHLIAAMAVMRRTGGVE